jgi:hypothetical protein
VRGPAPDRTALLIRSAQSQRTTDEPDRTQISNFTLSADGSSATLTLLTRNAGEIVVTMPAHCLDALEPRDRATAAAKPPATGGCTGRRNGCWEPR